MPIPLRRRRNFICLQMKYHDGTRAVISRCHKATYHISLARYITFTGVLIIMKSKQPKTEILRTRVSPEEREQIEYKALSSYRTVSRYLRDVALDKPIVIVQGVDQLADELRRIGNNLNQITRAVNAGLISTVDLTETREEQKKIWQSLNSLPRAVR